MRVLFTIIPAVAHLYPIVPLAWALQGAGHEVRVATHPDLADAITAAGLIAVPLGEPVDLAASVRAAVDNDELERIVAGMDLDPEDTNLRTAIRYYLLAPFANYFPDRPGSLQHEPRPMVDELVAFARQWQPDLVVWDPLFFPAPVAATAVGAAHCRLLWGLDQFAWARAQFRQRLHRPGGTGEDLMARLMAPTLSRHGLAFDEELLVGQWTIDPMPDRIRMPLNLRYVPMRWVPFNGVAVLPDWLREPPARPRVCLTMGISTRKFFAKDSEFPISALLEMVSELDIELLATLNPEQLDGIGTVPKNVRIIDYLPLNLVLPSCSAIIHHGGAGTFAAAAAYRVPQLFTPGEGGDFINIARYVADRGAGVRIDIGSFTVDELGKRLVQLLEQPSFATGTAALYEDMLAAPSPNDVVPVLEKLTAERRRPAGVVK